MTKKRMQSRLFVIALALCTSAFAGSGGLLGGQTGQESADSASCDEQSTSVTDSDDSVIGESAKDVSDALRGPLTAPFEWTQRQTTTEVTLELDYAGDAARRVMSRN